MSTHTNYSTYILDKRFTLGRMTSAGESRVWARRFTWMPLSFQKCARLTELGILNICIQRWTRANTTLWPPGDTVLVRVVERWQTMIKRNHNFFPVKLNSSKTSKHSYTAHPNFWTDLLIEWTKTLTKEFGKMFFC